MRRVVLWDFDVTLAHRPGMWSGCLLETLDEHLPGHTVDRDRLRPFLRDGFPWHQPAIEHPELCAPGAWWGRVQALLATAYVGVGLDAERSPVGWPGSLASATSMRRVVGVCLTMWCPCTSGCDRMAGVTWFSRVTCPSCRDWSPTSA